MMGMDIKSEIFCKNCNENIAIYYCPILRKKICNLCCDKYQLSDNPIEECLSCSYMLRDSTYKIKFNPGILFSHQYRDNYVFDNKTNNLNLKAIELYARLGVDKIDERYKLALEYHYGNMNDEALLEINNILKMSMKKDDKVLIYEIYGDVLLSLGEIERAKDAYVKSIDYGNKLSKVNRRLGELYASLREYPQAIYYHNKALEIYLSYEWLNSENPFDKKDSLYFTSYYSLASSYVAIKDYQNAIFNAEKLIEHYGGDNSILERYFSPIKIYGDLFIPELIASTYEILAISFKEMTKYDKAKHNIEIAIKIDPGNVQIAKLEGFIECKLEFCGDQGMEELMKKMDEINNKLISLEIFRGGNVVVGNQYVVNNSGEINNLVVGDRASINIDVGMEEEIKSILNKIKNNLDNNETNNEINHIVSDIDNKKSQGIKQQLSNLLVGVSSSLIANGLPELITRLSEVISNL